MSRAELKTAATQATVGFLQAVSILTEKRGQTEGERRVSIWLFR